MEYLKLSWIYFKHNYLKTLLFALVPALLFAFVYNPATVLNFFFLFKDESFESFGDIFMMMNHINGVGGAILYILAVVVSCILIGAMIGSIQRRMRYGIEYRNTSANFWNKVNHFFIPILLVILLFSLGTQIFIILFSIFAFIAIKVGNLVVSQILLIILAVLFGALQLFLAALFSTTLPNMTIKGWGFFKALKVAASECISHIFKIMFAMFVLVIILMIPTLVVNIFQFKGNYVVRYIFSFLFYEGIFSLGAPLIYTIFFEINEMEREDVKTYKEWGLK